MKVILVFPKVSNQSVYNNKLIRVPLGVLSLGHHARLAGADVTIIDERRCPDVKSYLSRILRDDKPTCIGFSVMTGNQIHFALELSEMVKECSTTPTVWGGVHPTLDPQTTVANPYVDYAVIGEGETAFPALVRELAHNGSPTAVAGVAYKTGTGRVVVNQPASSPDMNNLTGLLYEQLPLSEYVESSTFFNFQTNVILPVETSRGCPFSCSFCSEPAMDRGWRCMDASAVIGELSRIKKAYGVQAISFVDDLFFVQHQRSESIVQTMFDLDLGIEWYANVRAEYVVKHGVTFFEKVARSGCRSLTIGAEGGTDSVLKKVRKGRVTVQALVEANRILRTVGIAPHFSSIIGYPGEAPEDVMSTVMLACQLLTENPTAKVSLNKLIPTPGSPILTDCVKAGFRAPTTLEDWAEVFYADASQWLRHDTSQWLRRLGPICELIGMVHTGSSYHDSLFERIAGQLDRGHCLHSLFSSSDNAEALEHLLTMSDSHFRRYPVFGDERNWRYR